MDKARDLINCTKCVVCNEIEVIGRRKRRFYRFPREINECREWIRAIGLENLIYMPLVELYEQVVCDTHFSPQCFTARGTRLQKVTIPTISQYPSLPDSIMDLWPKSAIRLNPPESCGSAISESKEAEMTSLSDDEHIIDFNQPLMTCLETIKHNERHRVKKPAGNANTISVPLMTYSSSFERGTIFAPPEPKHIDFSKLPKLDFQYTNQVEPDNIKTNDSQGVVNVETQRRHKNHRDVVPSKKVFYGLSTTLFANKTVNTSNKLNRTSEQSEAKCKINSIHFLLSRSQFDKSKVIHHYKPVKKLNPNPSSPELLNPNTSKENIIVNFSLPVDRIQNDRDQVSTPIAQIDVTVPLLQSMEIADFLDITKESEQL